MKEAQKFLERKYPKYFRKDVKKLDISNRSLEGELDLTDFSNLEELNCSTNALTKIDLKNCRKLKILKCSHNSLGLGQNKLMGLDLTGLENLQELWCNNNYLEFLDYTRLSTEKLTLLNISSNNLNRFEKSNLAVFNRFVNLKVLLIGNEDPARVRDGIYNRWNNSLEQLQDSNLVSLGISNTDIDRGLENLSSTLKMIHCSNNLKEFKNWRVVYIVEQLKPYKDKTSEDSYNYSAWREKIKDSVVGEDVWVLQRKINEIIDVIGRDTEGFAEFKKILSGRTVKEVITDNQKYRQRIAYLEKENELLRQEFEKTLLKSGEENALNQDSPTLGKLYEDYLKISNEEETQFEKELVQVSSEEKEKRERREAQIQVPPKENWI